MEFWGLPVSKDEVRQSVPAGVVGFVVVMVCVWLFFSL
jgi:preprotein translocase subunit SecD